VSDLTTPPPPDHAAPFLEMAAKITTNRDNGFAGAFVIVGPGGEIEETLILDGKPNVSAFWSLIATKSQIAIAEAEANQQAAQGGGFGYGGGRR
jgi:hypothetical protein